MSRIIMAGVALCSAGTSKPVMVSQHPRRGVETQMLSLAKQKKPNRPKSTGAVLSLK